MELIRKDVATAVRWGMPSDPVMLAPLAPAFERPARVGHFLGRALLAVAVVFGLLQLTGCALIMPVESGKPAAVYATQGAATAEALWLGMHALDTAQTVTIARSPDCLWEDNKLAAAVYGSKHPSESRVLLTNVAFGALHFYVGGWLDRGTERALADPDNEYAGLWYMGRGAFYAFSFLGTGLATTNNAAKGIKPFSGNACRQVTE